jgi:hypothetical protein
LLAQGVRSSFIAVLIIGAILAAISAYFLPTQETEITRSAASEEIRATVSVVGPWVTELKDFKDLKELRK